MEINLIAHLRVYYHLILNKFPIIKYEVYSANNHKILIAMRIFRCSFILLILLSLIQESFASIIVINGLTHKHIGVNGSVITGSIQLKNEGDKEERAIIYRKALKLSCGQEADYTDIGSHSKSLGGWLKTNIDERVLQPEESYEVIYTITVPNNVTDIGTYWDLIMVEIGEPVVEKTKQGLQIKSKIRYGIQIITDIGTLEVPKLTFEKVEFKKSDKSGGANTLNIQIKNEGLFLNMPKLSLEIFDKMGIKVKVVEGIQKNVYPQYCNTFVIELNELSKGLYDGVIVIDNGKDLFGENISLEIE